MSLRRQNRVTLASSCESLEDPVHKLEQGLDALSSEGQAQVCEFYQYVNQYSPDLLPSVQEMIAQVLKDVRRHKAEQERLLHVLTNTKHEHHEQLRKIEDEVEQHMEKVKTEERKVVEGHFKTMLKTKNEELEDLRNGINRLENTLLVASATKRSDLEDNAVSLHGQVSTLQQENDSFRGEMTQILTQLALMKSELTTLRQDYQSVSRELTKAKIVAGDRSRESEESALQISILEVANRRLRDANEDLRHAFENSREARKGSVRESMSSVQEADEETDGVFRRMRREPSYGLLPEPVTVDVASPAPAPVRSYADDNGLLLQAALYGVSFSQRPELGDTLPTEPNDARLTPLFSSRSVHGSPLLLPAFNDSPAARRAKSSLLSDPSAVPSSSSGVYSCTTPVSRTESIDCDSNVTVSTSASHAACRARAGPRRLPSSDLDTDVEFEEEVPTRRDSTVKDRFMRREAVRYRQQSPAPALPLRSSSQSSSATRRTASRRSAASKAGGKAKESNLLEPSRMYKIVLAGDSAVGKSTFLLRFCKGKFQPYCPSTLGVDFHTKVVDLDGQAVALQLWDTAGQERFRSIAKSYFRRADGVLLLYDVTYERSFLSVREWVSMILDAAEKRIPIMLVGNKIDLRAISELQGQRCVSYEDGLRCARDHSIIFIECSAKDGTNIEMATTELARLLRANEDLEVKNLGMTLGSSPPSKPSSLPIPSCCN